jgi:hypothetical protein
VIARHPEISVCGVDDHLAEPVLENHCLSGTRKAMSRGRLEFLCPFFTTGELAFDNGITTVQVSLLAGADGGQKCRAKPLRRTLIVVGLPRASGAVYQLPAR